MNISWLVGVVLLGVTASFATASVCKNPRVTPSWYTTKDAFFHMATTFIVEFVLQCDNDVQEVVLYAEVGGRLMPVAISEETSKYQISWQEDHADAPAATYPVRIYDDNGYTAVRKAQRNNEDIGRIKPLFTVDVEHPGASKGPFISSETVMLGLASLVLYGAWSMKQKLQS